MILSPRKVPVVCSDNKIVPDVDAALKQISKVAGPMNARRHYLKHGGEQLLCVAAAECTDCHRPRRICNFTVVIEFQRPSHVHRETAHHCHTNRLDDELGI